MSGFNVSVINCKGSGQKLLGFLISELISQSGVYSDVLKTSLSRVYAAIDSEDRNLSALENACTSLLAVSIKLESKDSSLSYVQPITAIEIKGGIFTWQWSSGFMQLFQRHLAKIDKFNIWEVAGVNSKSTDRFMAYLGDFLNEGESGWLRINSLRKILLGDDSSSPKYSFFGDLRRHVLQPSIDDINMIWGFLITYEVKKKGNRFTSIKFKINKKEGEGQPSK
jgi:plasmid replication initiation protein